MKFPSAEVVPLLREEAKRRQREGGGLQESGECLGQRGFQREFSIARHGDGSWVVPTGIRAIKHLEHVKGASGPAGAHEGCDDSTGNYNRSPRQHNPHQSLIR